MSEAYAPQDCRRLIGAAERRHRIPAQLLSAISLAESGRWMTDVRATIAWPWTVYAEGEGRILANQKEAEAAVRALSRCGVRNIDVGCMQVNLQHHGAAFADLKEAISPVSNIDYAAGLLRRLYVKHRSWQQAVAHYHSATKALNVPYSRKVMRLWHKERRWAMHERRRLVQATYNRRRAARSK
ncbi:MAG: transglycosylase SLT domain-containing protein [Rhodospirillaceae bacterium]|nr:transglycosylase SLT domain-containing protein [Rhodospirillaceae bacterium]MBT4487586.1 transglycosylase SLT domain-containing protein [Rhodospirillaceae bacterium]MBT5193740.1 transglycosylase SLT domain-containing protein [Rhodospirillaceae bacterium]MBT5896553.1 transglycosylase SLT domain-containing protein [Rhodospirillaceae bacterium]MBT6430164.1 transglycosylase SLT domain-containing protein [Rhodospirillaceae bacterium]